MKPWLIITLVVVALAGGFFADTVYSNNTAIKEVEGILPQNQTLGNGLELTVTSYATNMTVTFQHTGYGSITILYGPEDDSKQVVSQEISGNTTTHTIAIQNITADIAYSVEGVLVAGDGTVQRSDIYQIPAER